MYHVVLGGQGYLIDTRSYRRQPHAPFAPKAAQGDRGYGDLRRDQVLKVSDWRGGEGYLQLDPAHPERYRAGYGVDVHSEPGSLRPGPHATTTGVGAVADEYTVAAVYQGALYVGVHAPGLTRGVYRWNGATWTLVAGLTVRPATLAEFRGKLYVGYSDSSVVSAWDGTAYVNVFTLPVPTQGCRALATFYRQTAQYLYVVASVAGTSPTTANAGVYWWDGATLSARQYDFEEPRCDAAVVLSNRLYFFTADPASGQGAVYSVDDSGSGGVYRSHVEFPESYPTVAAVYDGAVYVGTGTAGQIYRWDGTGLELVYQLGTAAAPYAGGELRGMAVWNGALWVSYSDGSGSSSIGLLRYDGTSWTRPAYGLAGTTPRGLARYNDRLHVLTAQSGAAGMHVTAPTYRSGGYVETGLFDAGLPSIDKVLRSATLTHAPIETGQAIEVRYRLEDVGGWVTLGQTGGAGTTSTTVAFPGTVSCKQVAFRVVLVGPAGGSVPVVLHDFLLRYTPLPELKREWELTVLLEGTAELPLARLDGSPEPLSGVQLSAALWALQGQAGPTSFVDLDGASRSVWITDLREEVAELSQRRGTQTVGKLRLVEA